LLERRNQPCRPLDNHVGWATPPFRTMADEVTVLTSDVTVCTPVCTSGSYFRFVLPVRTSKDYSGIRSV
jgi:hypothetical protein